jgi:hypothetical protein
MMTERLVDGWLQRRRSAPAAITQRSPTEVYSRCMPDLAITDRKIANSFFSRVASSLGVDGMTCTAPDAKRSFASDESRNGHEVTLLTIVFADHSDRAGNCSRTR